MTTAVVILSAVMIIALAFILRRLTGPFRGNFRRPAEPAPPGKKKLPCILCGAPLEGREKIKSKRIEGEKEDIVYLYGCPYCFGDAAVNERKCPVCKETMGPGNYLAGRMWKTKKNRLHLHVSGCTRCR